MTNHMWYLECNITRGLIVQNSQQEVIQGKRPPRSPNSLLAGQHFPSFVWCNIWFLTICVLTFLLMSLADLLRAGPIMQPEKEDVAETVTEEKTEVEAPKIRNRRNIAYYRRIPDFWAYYKYFLDTHNQEGVEAMDRIYRAYLQNKHRTEEGPTFNHYLTHLSEIYKACADSDDPDCISESTSKPKAKIVMPVPLRDAVLKVCNPYLDPYCLYAITPKAAAEEPSPAPPLPAPAKVPAPIFTPLLPMPLRTPHGYHYYAPVLESFLSAEQKAELLRICNPSDVECLQYHLRAAYGYRPALGPLPSYAHLSCDPTKDPYCQPRLVAKGPSGLYHLYPSCDPVNDPLCVSSIFGPAAQTAESGEEAPKLQSCNPLFDEGCNPLTATKLAGLTKPVLEFVQKDQPATPNLACDPLHDPYCLMGAAAALKKPPPLLPQFQSRYQLGVRGKTKEGYDCYLFYDEGCKPVESQDLKASAASTKPDCHPYDPSCGKFAPQASAGAGPAKTVRDGIIEPHPDCDPEVDYNCRLRRAEPASEEKPTEEYRDEPVQQESGHGDPYAGYVAPEYPVPRFEDFLRGYMGQYKK
ncbi:actinodin2 [Chanos chanos]|uniref:Actinodin2 n=1 Tax=Chanos chanos TaxID=29144 RepID=A0A6J2VGL5_CHACN|nr:uncharacterized protein LOC115812098 [Chanos chanos]